MRRYQLAAAGLLVLGLLVALTQFLVARPSAQDARTTADIRQLQTDVDAYARTNNRLPATLAAVQVSAALRTRLPTYEYRPSAGVLPTGVTSGTPYQLCATFGTDTATGRNATFGVDDPSRHPKGRSCFTHSTYLR